MAHEQVNILNQTARNGTNRHDAYKKISWQPVPVHLPKAEVGSAEGNQ
ncbi:hypothetical protein JW948_11395 [bacterium]|nr:hypothetical protein [bacterium]